MIQAAHYFFKGVYKHDLWRAALQMSYMSDSSTVSLGLFFVSHFAREMETSLNARVSLEETGSVQRRTTVPRPAFEAPAFLLHFFTNIKIFNVSFDSLIMYILSRPSETYISAPKTP